MRKTPNRAAIRVLVALATMAAAALLQIAVAAPASAGNIPEFNPKYTNGKCQSYYADGDCYHYAGTFTSYQGCINKLGSIYGVNPKTDFGKYMINQQDWQCNSRPPDGNYYLYVYQSAPPCAVGKPLSECPKVK